MNTFELPLEVAPRAILALGEDLVRDDRAAFEELVKNAYDADARNVRVVFAVSGTSATAVTVVDDGHGMSLDDVKEKWLVVATPNKLVASTSSKGRVVTGQKGIGRLATARLGATLEMATRARETPALRLVIDWASLSHIAKLSEFRVHVEEDASRAKTLGVSKHGTAIHITQLKRAWSITDSGGPAFDELEKALSRVMNPFAAEAGLSLTLEATGDISYSRPLSPPEIIEHPHYRLQGTVNADGTVAATYRHRKGERSLSIPNDKHPEKLAVAACGPFQFDLRAWDRDYAELRDAAVEAGVSLDPTQIRAILDRTNGVFVYRDDVLAYPKRDDDRDWLGLEARRVNTPAERLGLSHLVGAAFISRNANPELKDKSDREGLIENAAFREFRSALESVLHVLEVERLLDKPAMGVARAQPQTAVQIDRLAAAADELEAGTLSRTAAARLIRAEAKRIDQVRASLKARLAALGRLAAVGQLAGLLVHEIAHSLPPLGEALRRASDAVAKSRPIDTFLARALDSTRSIQRVVQRFTPFFVGGVRTRRKACALRDAIEVAVATRTENASTAKVILDWSVPAELRIKMDAGDALAVFGNLLDNGIHWAGIVDQPSTERRVRLRARADGDFARISVADSGPGIADDVLPRIFEPGFTLRKAGMGLGLAVARDILDAHGGRIDGHGSSKLGGARFIVHIPLEGK